MMTNKSTSATSGTLCWSGCQRRNSIVSDTVPVSDHLKLDQPQILVRVEYKSAGAISIGEYAEQDKVINADSTIIVLIIHLISQDGKNGKDKDVLFIIKYGLEWPDLVW